MRVQLVPQLLASRMLVLERAFFKCVCVCVCVCVCLKIWLVGHLGGSVVEHVPLALVVIQGSWDGVLHQAPCIEPASPSACVSASLYVSHVFINK